MTGMYQAHSFSVNETASEKNRTSATKYHLQYVLQTEGNVCTMVLYILGSQKKKSTRCIKQVRAIDQSSAHWGYRWRRNLWTATEPSNRSALRPSSCRYHPGQQGDFLFIFSQARMLVSILLTLCGLQINVLGEIHVLGKKSTRIFIKFPSNFEILQISFIAEIF